MQIYFCLFFEADEIITFKSTKLKYLPLCGFGKIIVATAVRLPAQDCIWSTETFLGVVSQTLYVNLRILKVESFEDF